MKRVGRQFNTTEERRHAWARSRSPSRSRFRSRPPTTSGRSSRSSRSSWRTSSRSSSSTNPTSAWVAEIGGRREEWKAEITHQEPDSHIAWRSIEGKENSGDVRFDSLGDDRTRIQVVLNWEPEGFVEATAEKIGRDESAVKADLEHFKEMVENRGVESGEWRGKVAEGKKVD